MDLLECLKKSKDEKYKKFIKSLIPNVDSNYILGVRMPVIRKILKNFNEIEKEKILNEKTISNEQVLAKILIIDEIKEFKKAKFFLKNIFKELNNWMQTDTFSGKNISKEKEKYFYFLKENLKTDNEYILRFCIVQIMKNFLDEEYTQKSLKTICTINTKYYYVNMSIAWAICESLHKREKETLIYFEDKKLSKVVNNMAIDKISQSSKFSKERKKEMKRYKII